MAKMTIAEAFDFPFHRIGQKNDGEPYYAVGTLRMEPLPAEAVEYAVDLPDAAFAPPVMPSFAEAVGAGIKEYAAENDIVGLRVTLTAIEANEIGSSDYWFHAAGHSALEDAIKVHGVFANPITIAGSFEQPLRWVRQSAGSEKYAVITLYLEPLPAEAVEYVAALSGATSPEDADPSFLAAVGEGVQKYAQEHGLVGVRVTLIYIQAHPVDSASRHFFTAAHMAMRQAIEAHGVPLPAKEGGFVPTKERAEGSEKAQDGSRVPMTPKRTGHTKETLKFVLFALVSFLIFGSLTAYEWHTRIQSGYYYPKSSFFFAAFAFGSAMLFLAGVFFPTRMAARHVPRSPEELQARIKAAQWKLGAFFAVCLLVGLLNLILLERY